MEVDDPSFRLNKMLSIDKVLRGSERSTKTWLILHRLRVAQTKNQIRIRVYFKRKEVNVPHRTREHVLGIKNKLRLS